MTAGGTREAVDEVRWLGNVASGALPAAMAEALLRRGWRVTYVHGPSALLPGERQVRLPLGTGTAGLAEALQRAADETQAALLPAPLALRLVAITSAAEAAHAVTTLTAETLPTLAICAMAVADYRPRPFAGKLSSRLPAEIGDGPALLLPLDATDKVIDRIKPASPSTAVLGFKLLAGADEAGQRDASRRLAERSGADWVFSNDIRDYRLGRRCGTLRDGAGEPLLWLDGGADADALLALAEALVASLLDLLPPSA